MWAGNWAKASGHYWTNARTDENVANWQHSHRWLNSNHLKAKNPEREAKSL